MIKYPKINSVYKRDDRGKFTNEFSQPEFEYLSNNEWIGTEKVDGTNIRIHWDGEEFKIAGRTDNAQLPLPLFERLNQICSDKLFFDVFGFHDEGGDPLNITLFGEGYGNRIQKVGSKYLPDRVDFILFDIKIGNWWLEREDIIDIARLLGINSVPEVFNGSLNEAIDIIKTGSDYHPSVINKNAPMEGLVLIPACNLIDRSGRRIITKLKYKDFE